MEATISIPVKLYIFFCSNGVDKDEIEGLASEKEGDECKKISLPCSGKADLLYLIKSFETGADGLALITCAKSNCRHLEGNLRSPRRIHELGLLLEEIGLGKDRVAVFESNGGESGRLASMIEEFSEAIRKINARHLVSQDGLRSAYR